MRFVRYDGDKLGLVTESGDGIIDLTEPLGLTTEDPLKEYVRGNYDASEYTDAEADHDLDDVRIESPVRRSDKVIAAPLNYENHIEEAISDRDIDLDDWFSIEDRGYFLKAPSSVIGPEDTIELPFTDRRVDHEIELALIIDEESKDISAHGAWENILGYTILLDITVRGEQDRSNRKSYDTFTVVGPWVVTPDEITDPHDLRMELKVNGETRQKENTGNMVYSCADIIQYASIGTTIEPGDVITTGTPEGVGPITDGDVVDAEIEGIGSMRVNVEARDVQFSDVDVQKSGQQG